MKRLVWLGIVPGGLAGTALAEAIVTYFNVTNFVVAELLGGGFALLGLMVGGLIAIETGP